MNQSPFPLLHVAARSSLLLAQPVCQPCWSL